MSDQMTPEEWLETFLNVGKETQLHAAQVILHDRLDLERLRAEGAGNPTASSLIELAEQKARDWQTRAEKAEVEVKARAFRIEHLEVEVARERERAEAAERAHNQLTQAIGEVGARATAAEALVEWLRLEVHNLGEALNERDLGAVVQAQWEAIAAADADRDRLTGQLAAVPTLIAKGIESEFALTNREMSDLARLDHDTRHEECGEVWRRYFARGAVAYLDDADAAKGLPQPRYELVEPEEGCQ